jgi:uncharacterized protein YecE (DUF72 family)
VSSIRIGTSGWHYDSWLGKFYPRNVRKKDLLQYYATKFDTTELNAPFLEAVECWREDTPLDFCFAWKASRFITHWKRLSEKSKNSIALLRTRLDRLGAKTGPVLFQLPPRFKADRERLSKFIKILPAHYRYAFEFRDLSWYDARVLDLLHDHDIALCISDHANAPAPWEVTAGFVYIRGHGPTGRYRGHYGDKTLRLWARRIRRWRTEQRDVFCYFDNDQKSAAPADAERLRTFLHLKPLFSRSGKVTDCAQTTSHDGAERKRCEPTYRHAFRNARALARFIQSDRE